MKMLPMLVVLLTECSLWTKSSNMMGRTSSFIKMCMTTLEIRVERNTSSNVIITKQC